MKKALEGLFLIFTVLWVCFSCTLGVPMVVETYHTLEAYHTKINASEQPIGPIEHERNNH